MKKFLVIAILALTSVGICSAQGYNRVGVSYNNTSYSANSDLKELGLKSLSTNGVGVDYIHGFSLSSSMPMFIETGAGINFNSGEKKLGYGKFKLQNFNILVPVNYVYRFDVTEQFKIAPYVGVDFKVNLSSKLKPEYSFDDEDWDDSDYSRGGDDYDYDLDDSFGSIKGQTFQMGWHVGVGFQYSRFHLGVQYGTDFLPAFKKTVEDISMKLNTRNLKVSLSYCF